MDKIESVAEMIVAARKVIVFTGAGISTESGIQDFRSPGGLWQQWNPDELTFDKFMTSRASREHYWGFSRAIWPTMAKAKPNTGHFAVAELYKMGKLESVITQNVDGLHQAAGVPDDKVIELHGTIRWVSCLTCGKRWPREEIEKRMDETGEKAPECDCGGYLKQATIAFGQSLPADAISRRRREILDLRCLHRGRFLTGGLSGGPNAGHCQAKRRQTGHHHAQRYARMTVMPMSSSTSRPGRPFHDDRGNRSRSPV